MRDIIFGRILPDSSGALAVLILLVEVAAAMGFYGSPALIYRFSIREAGLSPEEAKKFNLIVTALAVLLLGAGVFLFGVSVLTVAGVLIWCPFNYRILVHGFKDANDAGQAKGLMEPLTDFAARLFEKYQEIVIYIIVGVFATVVSWGVFFILSKVLDSGNSILLTVNTILNWCAGVLVAYPMNRSWVFKSKSQEKLKEFISFVLSRVGTLVIEMLLMPLLVNVLGIDQYIAKYVIASIVVIILNYVFSKLFVFKNKNKTG